MKLINIYSVNCHLLCLINIAAKLDTNYPDIFAAAWSEANFTHDEKHQLYITKTVYKNLKARGIRIKPTVFEQMPQNCYILIGMDTFHIPWSPVYQSFHGTHYFFAKKKNKSTIICFDPIYNKKYVPLNANKFIPLAFDVCTVERLSAHPPKPCIKTQAKAALKTLSAQKASLTARLLRCKNNKNRLVPIIKQLLAMISNRYMFKKYLLHSKSKYSRFFNKSLFADWHAIKNALYKATIQKDNSQTIDQACCLLKTTLQKEHSLASKILNEPSAR